MTQNVMQSLKGTTGVMANMNQDMNVQEISQVMKEFTKESMKVEMNLEGMQDGMSMLEDPSAGADAEDVYNGILGEIGLEY